jgi:hypothetical protein
VPPDADGLDDWWQEKLDRWHDPVARELHLRDPGCRHGCGTVPRGIAVLATVTTAEEWRAEDAGVDGLIVQSGAGATAQR